MKCTDTDTSRSTRLALTLTCVSALIVGLVPATQAEDNIQTIERTPESTFEADRESALAKFLEAGPISVRPHLYADSYYDDNITLRDRTDDWVWRIMPGVLLGMGEFRGDKGNYATIDYTLGGNIYSDHSRLNSVDHHVIGTAGWKLPKLTLGLSQSYEIENGKHTEASSFVEQETYTTLLTSKYELSEKTWFELNGRQVIVCSQDQEAAPANRMLTALNEWTVEGWGNYKVTEKVSAGLGGTLGWRDIRTFNGTNSPNQVYQQIAARSIYHLSEKVDLMGSVGLQFSQFQNGTDKGPTFVFSLNGSWHALENTYVALEAYRRDIPSYIYNGRNYTLTGLRGGVKQLILEKYTASLGVGYENSDYTDINVTNVDRTDNYFWIRPGFDYAINERWLVGLFYQYRTKSSSENVFSYHNNQVGVFSNYRF